MRTMRWRVMGALAAGLLLASAGTSCAQAPGPRPVRDAAGGSVLQRYEALLRQAEQRGVATAAARGLADQSEAAIRAGDRARADQLMRAAIQSLQSALAASGQPPAGRAAPGAQSQPSARSPSGGGQPVFFLPFTHHYNGPGGYYPAAAEVRRMGELFVRAGIPGTLFFDGILVERLQQEDPALIRQIREWNLPLGYHGEETHGPYPVGSELLGEVYTLREAQGYTGPWSLTTGKDWETAVKLVEERYSYARPYRVDASTHMIDRRQPSVTDRSKAGGLRLVQQAFGRDVSMMTSHSLESAPEGYAFRRMSRFGFDQPAVPIALHALKIFGIGDVAERIMAIAGADESIFWYMGRLHAKGDESGEAGYHLGVLRRKIEALDRSRPRLLLVGFSQVDEAEANRAARYLGESFFPRNPGSGWVTGDTLGDHFEPEKAYRPTSSDLSALATGIVAGWQGRPPDLAVVSGRAYSLADAFEALARTLAARDTPAAPSAGAVLHALYGPVAESDASLLGRDAVLPCGAIREAARAAIEALDRSAGDWFVPARVSVAGRTLNAGEFLYAMAGAVAAPAASEVRVPASRMFPPYADLLTAVFKPRAAQPVCYTQGQLWTVKPARLRSPAAPQPIASAGTSNAATLPKAIRVVFASNLESAGGCQRDDPSGADLYRVDFDLETGAASDLRRLTSSDGAEWFPALTPDGRFVAYDRTVLPRAGGVPRHDIWQIDLSRGREQLLIENARFPAFDGGPGFIYYSPQQRGVRELRRAPVGAGGSEWLVLGHPQVLADERTGRDLLEDPAPLADGSAVVFHRKEGSQGAGLALVPCGGGPAQALTDYDGCGHASVSPDGQSVACTRSRDGRIVTVARSAAGWAPPCDMAVSTDPRDYRDDARFESVREVRHSYVEWVTPGLLLVTSHGADGPRDFRLARLYLLCLSGDSPRPRRIDLSAAVEKLAGRRGKDFCSADGIVLRP